MNLDKIAQREARFVKVIKEGDFILKFYDIHFEDKPSNDSVIENVEDFIRSEIQGGNVERYSGLGFIILTNDTLNWTMWDDEYPILLQNKQYGFNEDYTSAKLLDIREKNVGSFCIWEIGVANHERKAWREYVDSGRSDEDLAKYLNSFIEGKL